MLGEMHGWGLPEGMQALLRGQDLWWLVRLTPTQTPMQPPACPG